MPCFLPEIFSGASFQLLSGHAGAGAVAISECGSAVARAVVSGAASASRFFRSSRAAARFSLRSFERAWLNHPQWSLYRPSEAAE